MSFTAHRELEEAEIAIWAMRDEDSMLSASSWLRVPVELPALGPSPLAIDFCCSPHPGIYTIGISVEHGGRLIAEDSIQGVEIVEGRTPIIRKSIACALPIFAVRHGKAPSATALNIEGNGLASRH
jgi:hypothetical protein